MTIMPRKLISEWSNGRPRPSRNEIARGRGKLPSVTGPAFLTRPHTLRPDEIIIWQTCRLCCRRARRSHSDMGSFFSCCRGIRIKMRNPARGKHHRHKWPMDASSNCSNAALGMPAKFWLCDSWRTPPLDWRLGHFKGSKSKFAFGKRVRRHDEMRRFTTDALRNVGNEWR